MTMTAVKAQRWIHIASILVTPEHHQSFANKPLDTGLGAHVFGALHDGTKAERDLFLAADHFGLLPRRGQLWLAIYMERIEWEAVELKKEMEQFGRKVIW